MSCRCIHGDLSDRLCTFCANARITIPIGSYWDSGVRNPASGCYAVHVFANNCEKQGHTSSFCKSCKHYQISTTTIASYIRPPQAARDPRMTMSILHTVPGFRSESCKLYQAPWCWNASTKKGSRVAQIFSFDQYENLGQWSPTWYQDRGVCRHGASEMMK